MKYLSTLIITISMFSISFGQNTVYDKEGKNRSYSHEDIDIIFKPSSIKFMPLPPDKQKEVAGLLLPLLSTGVDLGFKLTTKILENRVKKFSSEYSKQKSNLEAGSKQVPHFNFTRMLKVEGKSVKALDIEVKAEQVEMMDAFIYYIANIELNYSAAKTRHDSRQFDYTIEIKATITAGSETKVIDIAPIVISSVKFGPNAFDKKKHRTDLIGLTKGGLLTKISVKVVETNPKKVRAEKIAALWNDLKDDGKTIINNFLPKQEENKDNNEKKKTNGGDKDTGN